MNLTGRPVMPKPARRRKDPAHLARVAALPCAVCHHIGRQQQSPTTVHHWIHDRGSQRRTPDQEAIPLCDGHHQALFDKSQIAIHDDPARWRREYGPDHRFIAWTLEQIGSAPDDG